MMAIFRVKGVGKTDGAEVDYEVDAANEVQARQIANEAGVMVESARPIAKPPPMVPSVAAPAGKPAGLFSRIVGLATGAASETAPEKAQQEAAAVLLPDERVIRAFITTRDQYLFTDRRLILVDKMGLTGKRQLWHFIPYQNITQFSLETAGLLDLDAELTIWVKGKPEPLTCEFRKDASVRQICVLLAHFTTPSPG